MTDLQLDIEAILEAKKPNQKKAWVLLDPGLQEQMKDALDKLDIANSAVTKAEEDRERKGGAKAVRDAETAAAVIGAEVDALEAEVADKRVQFIFQSIGREAYSKLLDENKPRKGDTDDQELGFNVDSFPPRLIALSCIQPPMNLKQATKLWNEWGDTETTILLTKAIVANKDLVDIPFTRSGMKMEMLTTALQSTTPPAAESPTPSS